MSKSKRLVPFFTSLSTKIALITFIAITCAVSLTAIIILSRMEGSYKELNSHYAQTMAEDYARSIDSAANEGVEITTDVLKNMVGGAQMHGVDSSYVYVCDSEGIMLYHPTDSKIGQKVENVAVTELVTKMKSGSKPEPGSLIYDFKGVEKLAGFAVTGTGLIVVMTADYDDAMAVYNSVAVQINVINGINMLFLTVICLIVFKLFLRTIPIIVNIVKETSEFDFRESQELETVTKRKDELGLIARAVKDMRLSLKDIVTDISASSEVLTGNMDELKGEAATINNMCTDNSATTQELAAGMEETSATTDNINDNINDMLESAKVIDELASEGEVLSENVSQRARELKQVTVESTGRTENIYKSVREKAEVAIENAKIVSKINEMTNQIMEISSQTSLLALNASIEAARAGESGRGFAVVATEIGNLATQSANTVNSIDAMVKEVVTSVMQMQECLEETTSFIGENVINDYKEFEKVSDQYDADAAEFKDSMASIRNGVTELNVNIDTVADAISGINTVIAEAARGITDIAEINSDIVKKTHNTNEMSNTCKNEVEGLDEIVAKFVLE